MSVSLRKHQQALRNVVTEIRSGAPVSTIWISATPGAGKSMIPIEIATLTPEFADAICWVVPRKSLQEQGEKGFLDAFAKTLIPHDNRIRTATNDVDPCRGTQGFATTYQALGLPGASVVADDFRKKRYILILDEFHHVEAESDWHRAIDPLVEMAVLTVFMTGTLYRGDNKPIAWVPYSELSEGKRSPVLDGDPTHRTITYSRSDALSEQAILPIQFHLMDAALSWVPKMKGMEADPELARAAMVRVPSFRDVKKEDHAAAMYTALTTGFADSIIEQGVSHWNDWTRNRNPKAQLLVVAADYDGAKRFNRQLESMGIESDIATSHESKAAAEAIRRFKRGELRALSTIAMAYEGLDVPAVSHNICLTHIRSLPWIEQMIARAVRIHREAGPWEQQVAFVFAPDDNRMRMVVRAIQMEQAPFVTSGGHAEIIELDELWEESGGDHSGEGHGGVFRCNVEALGSEISDTRHAMVGDGNPALSFTPPESFAPVLTDSERERLVRKQIAEHIGKYEYRSGIRHGTLNSELKTRFGAPRDELTLNELETQLAFLENVHPLDNRPVKRIPGATQSSRHTFIEEENAT